MTQNTKSEMQHSAAVHHNIWTEQARRLASELTMKSKIEIKERNRDGDRAGAPNDRFLGNDLKWLVMHPGVL